MNFYFFDLDGTLEDSRLDMVNAVKHVRTALGLQPYTSDALMPHVNRGMRELYINCFNDFVYNVGSGALDENRISQVQKLYENRYGEFIAVNTHLYDGVKEILAAAKRKGRTAVITNKPEHLSVRLLEKLNVLHWVDLVVGGDTCAEAKPSAVPLFHAIERLGGRNDGDHVFMIGDSQGDSLAGALAGAETIWCAWGYQTHAPVQPPAHHTATTPEDLFTILQLPKN